MRGEIKVAAISGAAILLLLATGPAQSLASSNTVWSDDIVNGQVKAADIGANAVNGARIIDGTVTGVDIQNGTLTGVDVKDGSIGSVDVANGSLTGADVKDGSIGSVDVANNALTGTDINESSLSVAAMGCQTGLVRGFAKFTGYSSIPATFTSDPAFVQDAYNCAGAAPQVRRLQAGWYEVYFPGSGAKVATATVCCFQHQNWTTSIYHVVEPGKIQIVTTGSTGSQVDSPFMISLY